jgi:hypothetical protein
VENERGEGGEREARAERERGEGGEREEDCEEVISAGSARKNLKNALLRQFLLPVDSH